VFSTIVDGNEEPAMDQIKTTDQALEALQLAAQRHSESIQNVFVDIKSTTNHTLGEGLRFALDRAHQTQALVLAASKKRPAAFFSLIGIFSIIAGAFFARKAWK
jgi:hypothetical protein